MKVEIEKTRLGVTAFGNEVHVMIVNKDNITIKHKHNVHSDFLKCIVDYGENSRFNIRGDKETYQVLVKPKENHEIVVFTRKEVVDLLKKAVDGRKYSNFDLNKFYEENLK